MSNLVEFSLEIPHAKCCAYSMVEWSNYLRQGGYVSTYVCLSVNWNTQNYWSNLYEILWNGWT